MRPYFFLFLFIGIIITTGCSRSVDNGSKLVAKVLNDTTTRAILEERIVNDPDLRQELLGKMATRMNADTTITGEVCTMMMNRARQDTSLASHMCNAVASDSMMSQMMAKRLSITPPREGSMRSKNDRMVSDKTIKR